MSLTASLKLLVNAALTGSLDLASQRATQETAYAQSYSDGAGADQADVMFSDRRSVSASSNEDLDLSGGGLTNLLGASASFARVKAIIIKASVGNVNDVEISRPADTGFPLFKAEGDAFVLAKGEVFAWFSGNADGKAVTNSTADKINIANSGSGSAVEYEITIIGAAS